MSSNVTDLPSSQGANGMSQPLNRADEVDDVSGLPFNVVEPKKAHAVI